MGVHSAIIQLYFGNFYNKILENVYELKYIMIITHKPRKNKQF